MLSIAPTNAAGTSTRVPDSQKGIGKGFCQGAHCWLELMAGLAILWHTSDGVPCKAGRWLGSIMGHTGGCGVFQYDMRGLGSLAVVNVDGAPQEVLRGFGVPSMVYM